MPQEHCKLTEENRPEMTKVLTIEPFKQRYIIMSLLPNYQTVSLLPKYQTKSFFPNLQKLNNNHSNVVT